MIMEIPISAKGYNKAMLGAMNGFLRLTDFELEILTCILNNNYSKLDKSNRLEIRNQLNRSECAFNNYVKKLKDKKILIQKEDGLHINESILTIVNDGELTIKFNVN